LDLVDDFALEQLGIPRYRASEEIIYPGTIMILNNHRQNVFEACNIASRPRILEDPNENEISKIPLLIDPWNLFMREDARKFFQYKMTLSQFQDLGR
jgi:hypothetical protein